LAQRRYFQTEHGKLIKRAIVSRSYYKRKAARTGEPSIAQDAVGTLRSPEDPDQPDLIFEDLDPATYMMETE